jgi:IS30 family transposase
MKIVQHKELHTFVTKHLLDDQTPEAIAGRLKHQTELPYVSKNSIRNFIASPYGRRIEYVRHQRRLNRRRKRRPKTATLSNRRSIEKRPQAANQRQRVGDAEGDFIESGKDGSGKLLVIVDRKLRITFICQLRKVTVTNLLRALKRIRKRYPEWCTLTFDNDILFEQHERFEQALGIKIYFCHPYSSWEKGTVENVNKYIRRDIPKGSDINSYSPLFARSIENKLNRRMMKCLNYRTPAEALREHRARKQKQRRKGARKR